MELPEDLMQFWVINCVPPLPRSHTRTHCCHITATQNLMGRLHPSGRHDLKWFRRKRRLIVESHSPVARYGLSRFVHQPWELNNQLYFLRTALLLLYFQPKQALIYRKQITNANKSCLMYLILHSQTFTELDLSAGEPTCSVSVSCLFITWCCLMISHHYCLITVLLSPPT